MQRFIAMIVGVGVTLWATSALANGVPTFEASFVKLPGITGGPITGTAVYRADLSATGLAEITQIVLTDTSQGFGGFTGQFSGFDLDAIKLAVTSVDNANAVNGLTAVPGFNFFPAPAATSPGTIFDPGTQRAPVDPKLFGSVLSPDRVDPTVATLDSFDANSTIIAQFVKGFVSMGDAGVLTFNLTSPIDTTVPDFAMFLYIGEVGDNGETVGGAVNFIPEQDGDAEAITHLSVQVNGLVATVPEPSGVALMATGLLGLAGLGYRRHRTR
jgi:hypothetical protein